jgi:hypothetical protein
MTVIRGGSPIASPSQPVALLTATVHPKAGQGTLSVTDPQDRLRQYLWAFAFYLRLPIRVILAENSGADLTDFSEMARAAGRLDQVELLALTTDWQPEMGRGYAETLLVSSAMEQTTSLESAGQMVWKVTGRYQVKNLVKIIEDAPAADVYMNLRSIPRRWADLRVFGVTKRGWALLEPRLSELRSDIGTGPPETAMYDVVSELSAHDRSVVPRLTREPRISGVRGFDGRQYGDVRNTGKYLVRTAAKRVLPSVWI